MHASRIFAWSGGMSNSNPQDDRDQAHEDALKALHGIGDSDASEAAGEGTQDSHETEEDVPPSSGASGFVGMLAKEGATPKPVPQPEANPAREGVPVAGRADDIKMAREI